MHRSSEGEPLHLSEGLMESGLDVRGELPTDWVRVELDEGELWIGPPPAPKGTQGLRYLRELYEQTPAMMYSIDAQGQICEASHAFLDRLGYRREEVLGRPSTAFLDGPSRVRAKTVLQEYFRIGMVQDVPYRFVAKDGSGVDVLLSATAERDRHGQVVRSRAVLADVTEQRAIQRSASALGERALRAEEQVLEVERSKTELLQTMAHELRTPIHGILGAAELLEEGDPRPDQESLLGALGASAKHLLRLVDDVLNLARIDSGHVEIEEEPLELAPLLDEVCQVHRTTAKAKDIELRLRTDEDLPLWLRSDPTRLRQILHNLVSNGVKYTEAGVVTLEVRRPSVGRLRVSVTDTGPGIPADYQERVFQAFDRGEGKTARSGSGTGLGLPIAKRIVEAMGGSLELTSTVGEGSCFSLDLPVNEVARVEPETDVEPIRLDGVRVLLVEDHAVNALITARTLQSVGAFVVQATTGAEAIEQATHESLDLILMDLSLPDMDGYEATGHIRALGGRPGRVPIMAFSASYDDRIRANALAAGIDGFLSKPIELDSLRKGVSAAVRR